MFILRQLFAKKDISRCIATDNEAPYEWFFMNAMERTLEGCTPLLQDLWFGWIENVPTYWVEISGRVRCLWWRRCWAVPRALSSPSFFAASAFLSRTMRPACLTLWSCDYASNRSTMISRGGGGRRRRSICEGLQTLTYRAQIQRQVVPTMSLIIF